MSAIPFLFERSGVLLILREAESTCDSIARAGRCGQGCTARRSVRLDPLKQVPSYDDCSARTQNPSIRRGGYRIPPSRRQAAARARIPAAWEGPFPALVECHGGAWCLSDRSTERLRHQAMASHGIVSIALDFRSGNEDPYPASVQDINYAVRWAKLNSRTLKTRADLVGFSGQ